jgi:hypothetical protein
MASAKGPWTSPGCKAAHHSRHFWFSAPVVRLDRPISAKSHLKKKGFTEEKELGVLEIAGFS